MNQISWLRAALVALVAVAAIALLQTGHSFDGPSGAVAADTTTHSWISDAFPVGQARFRWLAEQINAIMEGREPYARREWPKPGRKRRGISYMADLGVRRRNGAGTDHAEDGSESSQKHQKRWRQ